ncbi:DMT family transporter [Sediminicurvatus halobius]|uniref:EamA/RhaT family transporter n=1 Tax=Sediminicurvatus halobius TaxID=2182432 RepID=A0A2U2MW99_9GAMM|nr:DMT family transporter [Spiribacter halobius]PWG61130.1 EamA/RhaT family transporter [Spiribacter halobius]UEX77710.1 DMT family transporter [Spiribacter halobius]
MNARAAQTQGKRAWALGWLSGITVVALFAGFTLFSRLGALDGLRPADLAALRFLPSGLVLLPVLLSKGLRGLGLLKALALAVFGGLGFALLAYRGFELAPAAHGAVFLHGMLPFFGTLIGAMLLLERPRAGRILGALLILTGVIMLGWDGTRELDGNVVLGDLSLLGASLCWSVYGALAQRFQVGAIAAASIVAPFALLLYLPPYVLFLDPQLHAVPVPTLLGQLIFQGLLIGVLSLVAYTTAVSLLGATRTALTTAAVPGVTVLGGILLLGEIPTAVAWAGLGTTTLGMLVSFLPQRPNKGPRTRGTAGSTPPAASGTAAARVER